jgi:hypothetical protein
MSFEQGLLYMVHPRFNRRARKDDSGYQEALEALKKAFQLRHNLLFCVHLLVGGSCTVYVMP